MQFRLQINHQDEAEAIHHRYLYQFHHRKNPWKFVTYVMI